jgi:hypothetical protein
VGEAPPATAAKSVQVYVSQLRKALLDGNGGDGRKGPLVTRAGGYPGDQPVPKVVTVPRFVEVSTSPTGIEWDDVAIGAGGAMGLVLVATGGALIVARRRRAPRIA